MLKKTTKFFISSVLVLVTMISFSARGESVTLEMLSAFMTIEKSVERSIIATYEIHNPNVKIKVNILNWNQIFKTILTRAVGGRMPDIYMTNDEHLVKFVKELDIVVPLDQLLGKNHIDKLYKPTVDAFTYQGKLYIIPIVFMPNGVVYRVDIFEKAGIQNLPETWPELLDILEKLKAQGLPGFALLGAKNASASRRFVQIMWSYGKRLLKRKPNGEWITEVDTPEAIEAFKMYKELSKYAPPGVTEASYLEGCQWVAANKASMMISGPHAIGEIMSKNPKLSSEDFGEFPIPKGPVKGGRLVSSLNPIGYSISKASKYKEIAADFLKFYTSAENQMGWPKYCGRIPTNKIALEWAKMVYPLVKGALNCAPYSIQAPKHSALIEAHRALQEAMQAVLTGTSPQRAAEACAEKVRKALERAKE